LKQPGVGALNEGTRPNAPRFEADRIPGSHGPK
jgi:hypothetical protein